MNNKKLVALICVVLLMVGAAGATLAWLTDTTEEVENTFTVGNIDIDMDETNVDKFGIVRDTENSYKMVPGFTIDKDPIITIKADSEPCLIFVELSKTTMFDDYIEYEMAKGWTQLYEGSNVYYQAIENPSAFSTVKTGLHVLKDDQVKVKGTVTKAMMDDIDNGTVEMPVMTFKAYAHQLYSDENKTEFSAADAWDNLK